MITRRQILKAVPALGISSTVFARALAQQAAGQLSVTREMIAAAKWVSGIELTPQEEESLVKNLDSLQTQLETLRKFELDPMNDGPAIYMQPLLAPTPVEKQPAEVAKVSSSPPAGLPVVDDNLQRPSLDDDLAFSSVVQLSALIRNGKLTSVELTKLYLERLKKYDPSLLCVVTLTEELALQQAEQADAEIAAGRYRGVLHGIPWGAKDLISVPGYPTTWGIPVFKERVINQTATVAQRLQDAGAVLVAKLSLGAIAMGDKWYRGMTRNPWNVEQGSSGSSAGSCSASSAGLVGFALGSETLGSILSPSNRCASHGLRPTFGRVSRAGCMPLSWSMDKIGPIARSVADLAIVFQAIQGPDGVDPTVVQRPFQWPANPIDFKKLRVGIIKKEQPDPAAELVAQIGCQIQEIELPSGFPLRALTNIIDIEAAAVFDTLLRAGETDGWNTWTKSFQAAQFVSAIDYLRMQRVRRKLMKEFEELMQQVDILLNTGDLMHTNFTGHPSVSVPFPLPEAEKEQRPASAVFTGPLFGEEMLLVLAQEFERRVGQSVPRPKLPA
jgi:Asp-tRNA(Asn)/Glu-tRNA(Gln) amidotransferase A subunit family amidase